MVFAICSMLYGADRPNIILLMGDDHGWAETGYYGHPHLKTPVLDEMARTGLRKKPATELALLGNGVSAIRSKRTKYWITTRGFQAKAVILKGM